jgi:hypothetical protein
MSLPVQLQHLHKGDGSRFGAPFFTQVTGLAWSLLRRLHYDLVVLILLGAVITVVAGWVLPAPDQRPRAAAERELDGRPGQDMSVPDHVTHIWMSERLVNLTEREVWSLLEKRRGRLPDTRDDENNRVLFYALTVLRLQTNGRLGYIHFIRYSFHQPEHVRELFDVLATAAGNPPRYPMRDYSTAVVHLVPAGTSRQELIDRIELRAFSRDSGQNSQ